MYIFKLLYLVNIFLGCFRPLRKNTYVSQITHQLKKNTHRLIEISTYKFITFRINYQNRVLNLYINITSRKTMYPIKPQTFEFTQLFMLFKKKMKVFDYSHTIIKKNKYSNFLNTKIKSNKIFKKSQKQSIRFQNSEKNKKTLVLILQEKKKNRKKNINTKKFIKHSTINVFFLKTIKNNIFIINNHTKLRRILLRSLKKKKKIINSENVSYFFRYSKNKTTKISILEFLPTQVFKFFAKTYVRNQFKKFKINKIFQGLIRKKKNQNFKYFLWYSNLKNIKNKINIFLHRNTPNFLFLNDDFTSSIKKKRNIETD